MSESRFSKRPPAGEDRPTRLSVGIQMDDCALPAEWSRPVGANGMVFFAHGSGSSRFSPRNRATARKLQEAGLATLLFDLLTETEERKDATSGEFAFDIDLLAHRLVQVTRWMDERALGEGLGLGFFGASTGAAAALVAAAKLGARVRAVVSRGGRADFAGDWLPQVQAPTLLIVGQRDEGVLQLNEWAFNRLGCEKSLSVVPGATHLFEEPGALDEVAALAVSWFRGHLPLTVPRLRS